MAAKAKKISAKQAPAKGTSAGGGKAEQGRIQSIERAAALLNAVARAGPGGIGLADLGAAVGLHVSTTFHLVKTLERVGYLARPADSKKYRIGSGVFTLAAAACDDTTLLRLGQPVLETLSRATGEAAHLAVRSNADIVLIARTEATGMVQMSARAGVVRPAHATAIGKLLLAQCPDAELDRLLDEMTLAAFTAHTITDVSALRRELADIRLAGVAHDRREFDEDVHCIAVPVRDFSNRCVAAMGLSSPVWRMDAAASTSKTQALHTAAAELSAALGAPSQSGK